MQTSYKNNKFAQCFQNVRVLKYKINDVGSYVLS